MTITEVVNDKCHRFGERYLTAGSSIRTWNLEIVFVHGYARPYKCKCVTATPCLFIGYTYTILYLTTIYKLILFGKV